MLKCITDLFILKKKNLFCVFVDDQKAFDTIWRDSFWQKLTEIGIHGKAYNVIVNMYKQVKSCVFAHGKNTDDFVSQMGVHQGENLSPLLFSM